MDVISSIPGTILNGVDSIRKYIQKKRLERDEEFRKETEMFFNELKYISNKAEQNLGDQILYLGLEKELVDRGVIQSKLEFVYEDRTCIIKPSEQDFEWVNKNAPYNKNSKIRKDTNVFTSEVLQHFKD